MNELSDKEVVEVLAKAVDKWYDPAETHDDGTIICRAGFWNPLHSLDDMAEVEAEIERRGLYKQYYDLRQVYAIKQIMAELKMTPPQFLIDRQPASVRARAAAAVILKETPK